MNLLHFVQSLFAHPQAQQHPQQIQQIPTGSPIPQAAMNRFDPHTRALAQIYQQNPMDPRVIHIDPKIFGYAPDNTAQMHFNIPSDPQGIHIQGVQNPGFTPLQNSGFGPQGSTVGLQPAYDWTMHPQIQAIFRNMQGF